MFDLKCLTTSELKVLGEEMAEDPKRLQEVLSGVVFAFGNKKKEGHAHPSPHNVERFRGAGVVQMVEGHLIAAIDTIGALVHHRVTLDGHKIPQFTLGECAQKQMGDD